MNNGTLLSAIRGPVMLITVGVLLAIDNMFDVSFSRTWPVIIIMFGVLKLLERLTVRPLEQPAYPQAYTAPAFNPQPTPAAEPPQEKQP